MRYGWSTVYSCSNIHWIYIFRLEKVAHDFLSWSEEKRFDNLIHQQGIRLRGLDLRKEEGRLETDVWVIMEPWEDKRLGKTDLQSISDDLWGRGGTIREQAQKVNLASCTTFVSGLLQSKGGIWDLFAFNFRLH